MTMWCCGLMKKTADFSYGYSTSTRRRDICKEFFRRVDDTNKQGVVLFNDHGSVRARLVSTGAQLSSTLVDICNGYNTNISTVLDVNVLGTDDSYE